MVTPADKTFFINEFGWGENWPQDFGSVVDVRECSKITVYFIFSLIAILNEDLGMTWPNMWNFITTFVLPSMKFKIDSKRFQYLYNRFFKVKNKKGHVFLNVLKRVRIFPFLAWTHLRKGRSLCNTIPYHQPLLIKNLLEGSLLMLRQN